MLATLLWQFNIVLFSVFSSLFIAVVSFPHEAKQIFIIKYELVLGAIPMGLATILNGF